MKIIATQPRLVAQVHQALLSEIAQGKLPPGARVIQEQIAQELGVSRQPVQQALLLLHNQGVLTDAPGRGLIVAPLDLEYVRNVYEIRAEIEGLAFRRAAERNSEQARRLGRTLIDKGRQAVASGSISDMISADLAFHGFIHELSRNALIAPIMHAQWTCTQRVMGEALLHSDAGRDIWSDHVEMLEAVIAGDGDLADELAHRHIIKAAAVVIERLRAERQALAQDRGQPASGSIGT